MPSRANSASIGNIGSSGALPPDALQPPPTGATGAKGVGSATTVTSPLVYSTLVAAVVKSFWLHTE